MSLPTSTTRMETAQCIANPERVAETRTRLALLNRNRGKHLRQYDANRTNVTVRGPRIHQIQVFGGAKSAIQAWA